MVSEAYSDQNIIMSPLSIQTLFSLMYMSARGQTALQMQTALDLPSTIPNVVAGDFRQLMSAFENNTNLAMANGIYFSNQFAVQPEFAAIAKNNFHATVQPCNFNDPAGAANTINEWVQQETHDKITNLVQSSWFTPLTESVLVNAVYFNGKWKHPFENKMTPNVPFYTANNCNISTKRVNMMTIKSYFNMAVIDELAAAVIELPYNNSDQSMLIFLPTDCQEFYSLNYNFGDFDFSTLRSRLSTQQAIVSIPEFSVDFEMQDMETELTLVIIECQL